MEFLDQYKSHRGLTVGEAFALAREYEQLQARIGTDNAAHIVELVQTTGYRMSTLARMWDQAHGLHYSDDTAGRALFEKAVELRIWPTDLYAMLDNYAPKGGE